MAAPAKPAVGNVVASLLEVGAYARRVVAEALSDGERDYWLRRARDFEQALSRPGDYHGQRTPEQVQRADDEIRTVVELCKHRASLCEPNYGEVA